MTRVQPTKIQQLHDRIDALPRYSATQLTEDEWKTLLAYLSSMGREEEAMQFGPNSASRIEIRRAVAEKRPVVYRWVRLAYPPY